MREGGYAFRMAMVTKPAVTKLITSACTKAFASVYRMKGNKKKNTLLC
jgi:hypothetical protein